MHRIVQTMINKYPELNACAQDTELACGLLVDAYRSRGKVLVCGNGGSAADSEHIVGELMKGFMSKRPVPDAFRAKLGELFPAEGGSVADLLQGALPAISLVSHSALMTAFMNDVSAETVFAQQVYGYGREGDVLIGLSTSGNSLNVVRAMQVAKALGVRTIGLTGRSGGRMKELCDVTIRVPHDSTPDIQERHLPIYHALCMVVEEAFFGA
ncbi:D-sedoheptulose-7-phosphate isomerase [Paenibacillus sacheonensis]|uniref:SIS domain-containing protein n=1 Tax=Paenibacillus sacheonensis TaxID=742054 RepID=A0A7X4YSM9_9BACL|nr:SIS domain-containing protein [Paenibacillus sacheonensis]MBM7568214.1 D-sedoheptulose 7-phosphate isomerase [Paenibacillus sacheonensis]NBC71788.1 SIS domain-containing protein [Paenibacillus sacheonensis]